MKPKRIYVKVLDDGSIEIEADGYTGKSCLKALDDIEKMFGVADRDKTKEKPELAHIEQKGVKA